MPKKSYVAALRRLFAVRENKDQIVFAGQIIVVQSLAFDEDGIFCHFQLLIQLYNLHSSRRNLIMDDSLIAMQTIELQECSIHQKTDDGELKANQHDLKRLVQNLHILKL